MSKYYVYVAYGVEEEVLYVGKGSGERYRHCLFGGSTNPDINRYYFQNGEFGSITVNKDEHFETDEEALEHEKYLIKTLKPLFNTDHVEKEGKPLLRSLSVFEKISLGYVVDYRVIMKQYIEAKETGDEKTAEFIELHNPICKRHLSLVPPDKIKALKYRKKDVEVEYETKLKKDNKFYDVIEFLNYKEGDVISGKDVVAAIKDCYKKLEISGTVSSRTIREYYNVKDKFFCQNGKNCRGYQIVSKVGMEDLTKQQINNER